MSKHFSLLLVLVSLVIPQVHADADPAVDAGANQVFQNVLHTFSTGALDLMERMRRAPESSYNPLTTNRSGLRRQIDQVLLESAKVLGGSALVQLKSIADQNIRNTAEAYSEIADLELQRSSPQTLPKRNQFDQWHTSVRDVQDKIDQRKQLIEKNKTDLYQVKKQMSDLIKKQQGVRYQEPAIDALLYSVTGTEDVQIMGVYANLKIVTGALGQYMQSSGGNLEAARKYYAIHCLLLRTLMAVQGDYIRKVDEVYMKNLDTLLVGNQQLIDQATGKMRDAKLPDDIKLGYKANLDTLNLSRKVASAYKQILQANRARMATLKENSQVRYDLAEHTFLTTEEVSNLVDLVGQSQSQFEHLMDLTIPPLAQLPANEMIEFRKISQQIAQ